MAYNPNVYLSSTLIRNVKLRALVPANQVTLVEDDFISLLNGELFGLVVPLIMKYQEDFYLTYTDITTEANRSDYSIPSDASGMKIRNVSLLSGNGTTSPIPRLTIDQMAGVDGLNLSQTSFFIKGNKIVLFPTPTDNTKTFRVFFYKRPNRIVKETQAARITLIDAPSRLVSLSNTPTTWQVGMSVHSVQEEPMFDNTSEDVVIEAKAGFTITPVSIEGMSVGNYVALKGESPFAHIPVEGFPLLEQAVVVKVLEALGDREGMAAAQTKLSELITMFPTMFSPRVDGQPTKIVNRNSIFKFTRR